MRYEAGDLGQELGIEPRRDLMKVLKRWNMQWEKLTPPKHKKKRKIVVDPHYGAGEHKDL